ncbi:starch-binding domain-containing protein 1 [Dendropsophus ebraccatus]|uniref:starch-binding domain-containing protein 1 n=1 Tax=Dendropsophus ebraccatus TaxID=150705 RepID=UPI0038318292
MVQAPAAADQLRSPVQGERVSAPRSSSMWPALVLGILTAIIAWFWYRGSGDTETPGTDPTGTPGTEQEIGEFKLNAADQESQEVREKKVYQTRNEQQPNLQVNELSDPKSASEVQSNEATTNIPLNVQGHDASVPHIPAKELLLGDIHENGVPKENGLHSHIEEQHTELHREEEAQADTQEHLLKKEEAQAETQEHLLKKAEAQADTQEHLLKKEEAQAETQEHLLKKEEAQAETQEHLLKKEEAQADTQEHLLKKEEVQANAEGNPSNVSKKEGQADKEEHPSDVLKREDAQADTEESPSDVPKKEEAQADIQEHLTAISEKHDEQTNFLTNAGKVDYVLEEGADQLDKVQSNLAEENAHQSDLPEEGGLLINGDEVYPPLGKKVQAGAEDEYSQNDLDRAEVQVNGCSALMSGKPRDQSVAATCQASKSEQENGQAEECLHSVIESPDGGYANGDVNRAKQEAEPAGCPLENSFVEGNAMHLLEAKKTLTQDPYLERIHTLSDDGNAIVADPFTTQESAEKSEIKSVCSSAGNSSTGLQDNSDVSASILNECTQDGLSNVHIVGTSPKTLPVDGFDQEKEMAGLGGPNTVEKTSFCSPSEANIHDVDHQKTRKVATIQPMPQNVKFAFKVHYITYSDSQIIAVTGDHEKLGKWETYVPLTSGKDGFWSHSITLPADTNLAWKFVMVEDGKIKRWEECYNRFLKTAHEDIEAHLYWGFP